MNELLLALRWYLAVQMLSLAGLPLCLSALRFLPDRGYGVAKAFGLLLVGWLLWLLGSVGWLSNSVGGILVAVSLVAAAGLTAVALVTRSGAVQRHGATASFALSWQYVLASEILFALAFAAGCLVRAQMPNIETAGGEKWMEIAFLRAILRSDAFPPHDPWLSGFGISYYYFGYVIVAMLSRLASVPASLAFNLGIATLFALTCLGSYSLVTSLIAARRADGARGALWGGFLGPLLVALVGNLEGILEWLHARGIGPAAFWSWLDIKSINGPPPPLASGTWVPTRFFWWWQASRVIHDYTPWGDEQEVIDEFPAFSFILGDMHPHVLALPFVLLCIALAFNLYLRVSVSEDSHCTGTGGAVLFGWEWPVSWWEFAIYAICLGALGFLNTWDFPIYLGLVAGAYALGAARRGGQPLVRVARQTATLVVAWLVGGVLLYLPFWLGFQSQAGGLLPNAFNPTRLPQFLVFFGPLVLPVVGLAVLEARRAELRASTVAARVALAALLVIVVGVALVGGLVLLAQRGLLPGSGAVAYIRAWLTGAPIPGLEHLPDARALISRRLLQRLTNPWTALGLISLLVAVLLAAGRGLMRRRTGSVQEHVVDVPDRSRSGQFVLLLIAIGALLTLSVEFVYLRDNFGTRMNTVFKFYFQAWVLWGIAGAYALYEFISERRQALAAGASLVIVLGLVYPALAIPARAGEQGNPGTLDGTAYLSRIRPGDYAAITWLNTNVAGSPVVLEAPADQYQAYVYAGRVSAHTGLPTLLGWAGHEFQWRGDYSVQQQRERDIRALYTTDSLTETADLLERYGIRYVYVGSIERDRYPASGLEKFALLMNTVYDSGDVTIYHR